ncbi:MAG TPA: aspartyl/asparaginyl beta-hydroxylase domain-containing protein [Caulobacteraceae bacterium]|nr:aspartyl/asparaginyl beta-hydroxylase domain-containing protein [Caulobacteraceae bacterium]
MDQRVETLREEADRAAAAGSLQSARDLLEQAVTLERGDLALWMSLAACRRGLGDLMGALEAVETALALDPRSFLALLMRGSLLERLGRKRVAGAVYRVVCDLAPAADTLPPAARRALEHAQSFRDDYVRDLDEALRAGAGEAMAGATSSARRRGAAFLDRLTGKRRVYRQEPVQFHYPGLPDIEFWEREEFPWLEALEAETPAIQAELAAVLAGEQAELAPYVQYPDHVPLDQWAELNHSPRWNAYHLIAAGRVVDAHAAACPKTMAAIAGIPQPHIQRRSPAAMFSVLAPRTRIPPHNGVSNTRLVMHLPLIVPPGCGFRVGSETRQWKVGEGWVFDDTIEHEAWNDSDRLRTILICDVWNPRLTPEDREIITAAMCAMDDFSGITPDASV